MIYIVCKTCKRGLRVASTTPGEVSALLGPGSEYHPDKYPCYLCGESHGVFAAFMDASAAATLDLVDVNPQEALAAMHGLGLPAEQDCSAAAVQQLLEGKKIHRVRTQTIRNSHRCVIEFIELEEGVRVYFGASTHGATIYRVSKVVSYADRVQPEDHPGVSTAG